MVVVLVVVVVCAAGTEPVTAGTVVAVDGAVVAVPVSTGAVGLAIAPRSTTTASPKSVDSAISFCCRSARARLNTPKIDNARHELNATVTSWRGTGSRARRRPRHHAPTTPLRIGISMYRNDAAVTMSVATIATTNCGHVSGLPAIAPDDLVDRPVIQVHPVRAEADPQEQGVAEHRPGERPPVGHGSDHHQ